jgi:hypothetical protein
MALTTKRAVATVNTGKPRTIIRPKVAMNVEPREIGEAHLEVRTARRRLPPGRWAAIPYSAGLSRIRSVPRISNASVKHLPAAELHRLAQRFSYQRNARSTSPARMERHIATVRE